MNVPLRCQTDCAGSKRGSEAPCERSSVSVDQIFVKGAFEIAVDHAEPGEPSPGIAVEHGLPAQAVAGLANDGTGRKRERGGDRPNRNQETSQRCENCQGNPRRAQAGPGYERFAAIGDWFGIRNGYGEAAYKFHLSIG